MNRKSNWIDDEEKQIINSLNSVNESKLKNVSTKRKTELQKTARNYFKKKETKMNIRISDVDLKNLKTRAGKEGLKYSTFVKSVLHKYLTGQLTENNKTATHFS